MMVFNPKRYLFARSFAGFWLIVLVALSVTALVNPLNFSQIYSAPLTGAEKQNFIRFTETLARVLDRSPALLDRSENQPRLFRNKYLYLHAQQQNSAKLSRPLPGHIDLSPLNSVFGEQPQHIFSQHFHAIGPTSISIGNQQFWLFEIQPERGVNLSERLAIVPTWLKAAIALGISGLLTFLFTRSLVNPVISLRNCARQIAKGKFSVRHQAGQYRDDEIGQLSKEFNNMAARLEAMEAGQKRLFRDISHELRSPLMRLNTANVIAQERADQAIRPYLNRIEQESAKLETMISELLTLSRLESQQQSLNMQQMLLSELLAPLLADATFYAESCHKSIVADALPRVSMSVDKELISRALDNLLRNAIKYAEQQISVSADIKTDMLEIVISDDGAGVDEAQLPRLVEPFYRIESARDRETGGYGIGLAIANGAVKAHGGELRLQKSVSGGLSATLLLPMPAQ